MKRLTFIFFTVFLFLSIDLHTTFAIPSWVFCIDVSGSAENAFSEWRENIEQIITEEAYCGHIYIIPIDKYSTVKFHKKITCGKGMNPWEIRKRRELREEQKQEIIDHVANLKPYAKETNLYDAIGNALVVLSNLSVTEKHLYIFSDFLGNVSRLNPGSAKDVTVILVYGDPEPEFRDGHPPAELYNRAKTRWEDYFNNLGAENVNMSHGF